jgi:ElaB/YqjD/DUF883 family membrane-anchored ribosome-binding protein
MKKDLLERAKGEYLETPVSEYLKYNGWQDLRVKLADRDRAWKFLILGRGLAFAAIVIFLTGVTVVVAQAAKPGDGLYNVKVLADRVYAKVTGNYEIAIQRRADDVINSTGNRSRGDAESAKEEYKSVLNEAKKELENSGDKEEIKKSLEEQVNRFKKEIGKNSGDEEQLDEIIKETEKIKGEVKGDKIESGDKNPVNKAE